MLGSLTESEFSFPPCHSFDLCDQSWMLHISEASAMIPTVQTVSSRSLWLVILEQYCPLINCFAFQRLLSLLSYLCYMTTHVVGSDNACCWSQQHIPDADSPESCLLAINGCHAAAQFAEQTKDHTACYKTNSKIANRHLDVRPIVVLLLSSKQPLAHCL